MNTANNKPDPGDAMDTKNSPRQPGPAYRPVGAPKHRKHRLARWTAPLIATIVAALVLTLAGVHGTAEATSTLFSNLGGSTLPAKDEHKLSVNDLAQPFLTGGNPSGYHITSVSIDFAAGGASERDPVYVGIWPNAGGVQRPASSGQIAWLTKDGQNNFASPVVGMNKYSVRSHWLAGEPRSSVHLDSNTDYWVTVWAGEDATTAQLAAGGAAVSTGTDGWAMGPAWAKPEGTDNSAYEAIPDRIRLKVEGTTNPEVLVSASDVTITEGVELTADFVVNLSRATSGVVRVRYRAFAASAEVDVDFENTVGWLTFNPGETTKTVSVPILDDAVVENNEEFTLFLTDLDGASFASNNNTGVGVGTIVNADPLTVSISDATATEGDDDTIDFTVSLNRATNRRITINVLFSSGTADFSDVTDPNVQVVFEPGETEKTYSFGVVDDGVNEPSETFTALLQTDLGTSTVIADDTGTGTILNTETLEASFENVPQDHDGSTAFTFNVAFDNDISITPTAMRDHAFTVTNGDVTGAEHVNGSSTRWLITVDPDGDQAITIKLPGNRACATQGAICSDEDNPVQLGNSPSATVAAPPEGDPLTASFSNVPDSHNGSDFSIDLTFSEGPRRRLERRQERTKRQRRQHQPREPRDPGQQRRLGHQGPAGRDR